LTIFVLKNEPLHTTPISVYTSKNELLNKFIDKSDTEIWNKFVKGDDDAFAFIYNKYIHQLLRFGIQFAPREIVKDSITDIFIQFRKGRKTKKSINITPYLYKSLFRVLNSKTESLKRMRSFEEIEEIRSWQINLSADSKLIAFEQQTQQTAKLKASFNSLSKKQRQAILLYYYEGFTHDEIKGIMGLRNKSSVRKLIYRGLDTLKKHF